MIFQFHLKARGASGRLVRLRQLTGQELLDVQLKAAKRMDSASVKDFAGLLQFRSFDQQEGLYLSLVGVTKEAVKPGELANDKTSWIELNPGLLMDKGFDEFFSGIDMQIVKRAYRDLHDVNDDEMDDILGKAVAVSDD